jgi:hypothetical protein
MKRAKAARPGVKQLTEAALELLCPPAADRNACDAYIQKMHKEILLADMHYGWGLPEKIRKALQAQLGAVKRLQATEKNTARVMASYGVRDWSEPLRLQDVLSLKDVMIEPQPDLAAYIEKLKKLIGERSPSKPGPALRAAALAARDLLEKYGRPVTTYKNGDWCKLAAILYGEPNRRMDRNCSAVQRMDRPRRAVQPRLGYRKAAVS